MNVVGGYVVTDRMLQMFKQEARRAPKPADEAEGWPMDLETISILVRLAWLAGASASSSA